MRTSISILCVYLMSGCAPEGRSSADVTLTAESQLTDEEKRRTLAKVGDRTITLQEFEARLNQTSPFAKVQYESANRKRELLDNMVRFELLALEAERKGFKTHPQVILAQKQALVRQLTVDDLSQLVSMADVNDEVVRRFYDDNIADFSRPQSVRAAQIVTKNQADAVAVLTTWSNTAPKKVDMAVKHFKTLAKEKSIDELTASKGGDLGYFGEPGVSNVRRLKDSPKVPAAVAQAAFGLKAVGEVSPAPIKTSQGWHVIQKTGYRPAFKQAFATVKNSIRNRLFKTKKREAMEAYVKDLRAKASIEVDEAALAEAGQEAARRRSRVRQRPQMPANQKTLKDEK